MKINIPVIKRREKEEEHLTARGISIRFLRTPRLIKAKLKRARNVGLLGCLYQLKHFNGVGRRKVFSNGMVVSRVISPSRPCTWCQSSTDGESSSRFEISIYLHLASHNPHASIENECVTLRLSMWFHYKSSSNKFYTCRRRNEIRHSAKEKFSRINNILKLMWIWVGEEILFYRKRICWHVLETLLLLLERTSMQSEKLCLSAFFSFGKRKSTWEWGIYFKYIFNTKSRKTFRLNMKMSLELLMTFRTAQHEKRTFSM